RGVGKTRAGAEWVRGMALGLPGFSKRPVERIALVGETLDDVRSVMIEGESGLLGVHPIYQQPRFDVSKRQLVWSNGSIAQMFSGNRPDSLRGPQFGAAWCDELCKWRYPQETWDMLQFALRLGDQPRQIVTTTPRPIALLKQLMEDKNTIIDRVATSVNSVNLARGFMERMNNQYGGTRLGRQELQAEILQDREDALWSRKLLDSLRLNEVPELMRIVVAVDPPVTSHAKSDACGIIVAGLDEAGRGVVLADESLQQVSPLQWARAAIRAYNLFKADRIVAEVNQGGEMVETLIRQVDQNAPVRMVRASRGKFLRAEPVAALYEQGRVRHVGALPRLEDEMCDFGPGGLANGKSPDRLDALVWALTDLMLNKDAEPRVRSL
ncbi:MAG: terminase family protein, partial [Hyphomicrobiaceae bacterium]|nr:terminase family protein [Hyphomicrobiaceae bacterium]